ncbi:hypothetical protein B0H14DRAFT_3422847 [Mycena olivaceomarginata]|nr:hypothetical protein B0H14DRAFT_3422847 [Mycena olivaceomarginata]
MPAPARPTTPHLRSRHLAIRNDDGDLNKSSSSSAVYMSSRHQPVRIVSTLARCATAAKQLMCRSLAHGAAHAPAPAAQPPNISRVQPPPATAPPTAHAQPATALPAAGVEPTSMMPPAAAPSAPATPKRSAQCYHLQSTLYTLRTFVF